jgi:adenosylcobinamide kinase/adenosylcobinamide-phosphate guanylyltransferase
MTVFVLGPNNSGKSAYAEKLAASLSSGPLCYIATMVPYGEEGRARVEKHRKQRAHMGFVTLEQPIGVAGIPLPADATVLLEDVSNLLGNTLHGGGGDVFGDIAALCQKCRNAVLVSISGLEPRPEHDDETKGYIAALNRLNGLLADFADKVVHRHALD